MKWVRIRHWFLGHPDLIDIKEEYGYVADLIANISYFGMSGWCIPCKRKIFWEEENTGQYDNYS